jgi:hypothetical protein
MPVSCRAKVLRQLIDHLIGVNQVEGLSTYASKASFAQEVLSRAYSLHVLVSAIPGWHWSLNRTHLAVDEPESLIPLAGWLLESLQSGAGRKKRLRSQT